MRRTCIHVVLSIAGVLPMAAALANAGRVDFAVGEVSAQQTSAQPRPLVKGADVLSGDKIVVRDGRAQIRFNDGAYVSLLPNTEFHIRDFRYSGKADGTERSWTSLLRGTVRAVSGLVGRVNKSAYQIETPTATLGIRGTAGIIEVATDGTTKITTTSGIWTMTNRAGTMEVPAGQAGITTPNQGQAPQRTTPTAAAAPPAANEKPRQQQAQQQNQQQQQTQQQRQQTQPPLQQQGQGQKPGAGPVIPPPGGQAGLPPPPAGTQFLPPPPGGMLGMTSLGAGLLPPPPTPLLPPPPGNAAPQYISMFAVSDQRLANGNETLTYNQQVVPVPVDGSNSGQGPRGFVGTIGDPTSATPPPRYTGVSTAASAATAAAALNGFDKTTIPDGTLRWGRWDGTNLSLFGATSAGQDSIHFVGGLPALNVPSNLSATFNLIGGTVPTNNQGFAATLGTTGALTVDFANPSQNKVEWTVNSVVHNAVSGYTAPIWQLKATGPVEWLVGPGGSTNLFGPGAGGASIAATCTESRCGGYANAPSVSGTAKFAGVLTGQMPDGSGGVQAGMTYRLTVNQPNPSSGVFNSQTVIVPTQTLSGVAVFKR